MCGGWEGPQLMIDWAAGRAPNSYSNIRGQPERLSFCCSLWHQRWCPREDLSRGGRVWWRQACPFQKHQHNHPVSPPNVPYHEREEILCFESLSNREPQDVGLARICDLDGPPLPPIARLPTLPLPLPPPAPSWRGRSLQAALGARTTSGGTRYKQGWD